MSIGLPLRPWEFAEKATARQTDGHTDRWAHKQTNTQTGCPKPLLSTFWRLYIPNPVSSQTRFLHDANTSIDIEVKSLCHSNKYLWHWQSRFVPIQTTTASVEIINFCPLHFVFRHHYNFCRNCNQINIVFWNKLRFWQLFFCVRLHCPWQG